jgi:hypothetical protein
MCRDAERSRHTLTREGPVDEFWSWVNPYIWANRPRIFDGVVRFSGLISPTSFPSGVLWLRYRPTTS